MTIDTSREAVERLLDGVTRGPWYSNGSGVAVVTVATNIHWHVVDCGTPADARFIAAARELVPALLAERDAALAEVASLSHALAAETAKRKAMDAALDDIADGMGEDTIEDIGRFAPAVARATIAKHGSKT